MSNDAQRPERVTLSDAMLTGLHEAGWFARADIDPDHLNGLVHDATDAVSEWLAAREQALREEIAGEIEAEAHPFRALADPEGHRATLRAARIARGETR